MNGINTKPVVSVIMPVYNTLSFLTTAIESVIHQTYPDWELILIDDGSTDGSEALCDKYAADDPRIHVIHQENRGVSAARNAGIFAAAGSYLQFLDSDDWLSADALETLVQTISEAGADMVIFDARYEGNGWAWHETSTVSPGVYASEYILEKLADLSMPPYVCNKFCQRSLYDGVCFPLGERWEDVATSFYPVSRAERIAVIDRDLYHYFQWNGAVTKLAPLDGSIYKWRYIQYRKRYEFLCSHYPQIAPVARWSVAKNGMLYYAFCLSGRNHKKERADIRRFLRTPGMGSGLSGPRRRTVWLSFCLFPGLTSALIRAVSRRKRRRS